MAYPGKALIKSITPMEKGDPEVEYGSNTQRVMNLEAKYGSYQMFSNVLNYDELKKLRDFQILKFKDAIYRGQIMNGDRREG
jgi:hypothetical protein